MAYHYVASAQPATMVRMALCCNLTGTSEAKDLVIAKKNTIEVRQLEDDGLISIIDAPLNGRISAINAYRPPNEERDLLFVLTSRYYYCVLGYNPLTKTFVTRYRADASDKVGRPVEDGPKVTVDPGNRVIGMRIYDGLLKIVPASQGLKGAFNLRLDKLAVLDVQFLYECIKPSVCILFIEDDTRIVETKVVDEREKCLATATWCRKNVDPSTSRIIAVPRAGGALLVAENSITYVNPDGDEQSIVMNRTLVTAYCGIGTEGGGDDKNFLRFLLGDAHGKLSILILQLMENRVVSMSVDSLGITSIPNSLCFLGKDMVFVGSTYGDAQLVRLLRERDENGDSVEVVQEYDNIGPITDMCVVDSGTQGQSHVVLCSGAFKDGSLRVVRAGIGIYEQASVEAPGIKGLWRLAAGSRFDKYLVQSFIGETRVLMIQGEEMGETEIDGFKDEQTLFCSDVASGCLLQVTSTGARLVCATSLQLLSEYTCPDGHSSITVATAQGDKVVLALSGGKVVLLSVQDVSRSLVECGTAQMENDIACLSLGSIGSHGNDEEPAAESMEVDGASPSPPTSSGAGFATGAAATMLAIGTWSDATVRMLALPSMQVVAQTALGVDVQSRDLLIVRMGVVDYLLVGLGDGTLLSYELATSSTGDQDSLFGAARRVALGSRPISLSTFVSEGQTRVFVSCDRPTVIYNRKVKLQFSVVNVPEVTCMAPFSSEVFPNCLSMATETDLVIGTVDSIQEVHITKRMFGYSVRRIAHHPQVGLFVVAAEEVKFNPETQRDESKNFVLFLDESSLEVVHVYHLEPMECALCLCVAQMTTYTNINGPLSEVEAGAAGETSKNLNMVAAVGTAFVHQGEPEPKAGKIHFFQCTCTDGVKQVDPLKKKLQLDSGAYSMDAMSNGKIVVGTGKDVKVIYMLSKSDLSRTPEFETSRGCDVFTLKVKTHGDLVIVGDLMRSITLLKYEASTDGPGKLQFVARDSNAHWIRDVSFIDDEHYLAHDDAMNTFVMKRAVGVDDATDESPPLKDQAEFHEGDYINVFAKGNLNSQPAEHGDVGGGAAGDAVTGYGASVCLVPDANGMHRSVKFTSTLYGTVSGAIGVIMHIDYDSFRFYSSLEAAINQCVTSVGELSHKDWRSTTYERRPGTQRNVVDGDAVERFIGLPLEDQENIVSHLNDLLKLTSPSLPPGVSPVSSSSAVLGSDAPPRPLFTVAEVEARVESMIYLH